MLKLTLRSTFLAIVTSVVAPLAIAGPGNYNQQGPKLVGAGSGGQGLWVSISADGNTALFTGNLGAWVFTRNNGTWAQQGNELVPADIATLAQDQPGQGPGAPVAPAVALSGDGNTAIVATFTYISPTGWTPVAWVFTRSGGVWSQQGGHLIGKERRDCSVPFDIGLAVSGNGDRFLLGTLRTAMI